MQLTWKINPYIPVTNQRHLVYVLIEVDPQDAPQNSALPINLGLVVDASRSMSIPILTNEQFQQLQSMGMAKQKTVDGVKVWQFEVPKGYRVQAPSNMDFTKDALRVVAGHLRPTDLFSLVAFAEDALLLVSSSSGTRSSVLLEAIDRLDRADLGDETYMARGMEQGLRQIRAGLDSGVATNSRMIVLTDGYTRDEQDALKWTELARQAGTVVSTMGLGLDFNEQLLISIADRSGGESYLIEDPQEIPAAFGQELARAQSVSWRNLAIELNLPSDVILRRAHRVRPAIAVASPSTDGSPRIELGHLEFEHPPAALLELIVPPRPEGTYRLAQVTLRAQAAGAQSDQVVHSADALAVYTERPSLTRQTDPELMSVIQAVSAFKLQSTAMEEAERGNVARATRQLRTAGERLIEIGQDDLGQTMLVEADLLEQEGQMSSEGTKRLRYGTRKLR